VREHLAVGEHLGPADLVHRAQAAGPLQQPHDRLGQLEDMQRLHLLLASPGQRDQRKAGQRGP
jgi:hypothetical protein